MRLTTKLSGIVAIGGVAALGAGLISSGGIGAVFTDVATATGNITTGTIACEFQNLGNGVTYSKDDSGKWHNATVNLADIQSSTGSESKTVRVKNTGSMPVNVSWEAKASGPLFYDYNVADASIEAVPTIGDSTLLPGHSEDAEIWLTWSNLDNHYLDKTGSVTYTITCVDGPQFGTSNWLFTGDAGGSSELAANGGVDLKVGNPGTNETAGIRMLAPSGISLPAKAPNYSYTTTKEGAGPDASGALRFNLYFNKGGTTQPAVLWLPKSGTVIGGAALGISKGSSWQNLVDIINANPDVVFEKASVLLDTSGGGNQTVTMKCVNFTGTPLFGTGC